jgi:hypothetical protein
MKLSFACAYVDESETKFLAGVKTGKWPHGARDGGNVYWFREDLDTALDRLKSADVEAGMQDKNNDSWDDFIGQT